MAIARIVTNINPISREYILSLQTPEVKRESLLYIRNKINPILDYCKSLLNAKNININTISINYK